MFGRSLCRKLGTGVLIFLSPLGAATAQSTAHPSSLAAQAQSLLEARGQEAVLAPVLSQQELIDLGEDLFFNETFGGNGRTCGTCHVPQDDFGLRPATIAALPPTDKLFIAEFESNLTNLEHPSLMRSSRALILENIDGFANPPV